jgi:hypothetical protein
MGNGKVAEALEAAAAEGKIVADDNDDDDDAADAAAVDARAVPFEEDMAGMAKMTISDSSARSSSVAAEAPAGEEIVEVIVSSGARVDSKAKRRLRRQLWPRWQSQW